VHQIDEGFLHLQTDRLRRERQTERKRERERERERESVCVCVCVSTLALAQATALTLAASRVARICAILAICRVSLADRGERERLHNDMAHQLAHSDKEVSA
jgi:hypothetical protein